MQICNWNITYVCNIIINSAISFVIAKRNWIANFRVWLRTSPGPCSSYIDCSTHPVQTHWKLSISVVKLITLSAVAMNVVVGNGIAARDSAGSGVAWWLWLAHWLLSCTVPILPPLHFVIKFANIFPSMTIPINSSSIHSQDVRDWANGYGILPGNETIARF